MSAPDVPAGAAASAAAARTAGSGSEAHGRLLQSALLRAHRRIVAGEVAAALAHEVQQPLTALVNLCEATTLLVGDENEPAQRNLRAMARQIDRAGRLVDRLCAFIGRRGEGRSCVDVNTLANSACELVAPEAAHRGSVVELDLADGPLVVAVVAVDIEHALVNLLQNAIEAVAGRRRDGRIRLATRRGAAGTIEVRVADNGSGFALDDPERAFEPFYTTKAGGPGLGLAIARDAVEANAGRLRVESSGATGATLCISLPVAS